ncbi:MAG: hypothetical protein HY236_09060 [Acidobacteria bacterium]|nr:hypothetical protein [Acidobacteriota bacterium]
MNVANELEAMGATDEELEGLEDSGGESYLYKPAAVQETAPPKEAPFSVKRLLGAALFGCLITSYGAKACEFTVPTIISIIENIDKEAATDQYQSSAWFACAALGFGALLGSGVAAFLARRYVMVAGLLANLPFVLLFLKKLGVAIAERDDSLYGSLSFQLYSFLQVSVALLASGVGAMIGQKLYSRQWDPDLSSDKVTIFGVRWGHYFWILPVVVYPYLSSLIMAVYAGVLTLLADYYVAFHPSLWFSLSWMANAMLNPLAVYFAFWLVFRGFGGFLAMMRYGQSAVRGVGKFGRVLLYGIVLPSLSFGVAAVSASITHSLPKPTPGDWKIGLGLTAALITISLAVQAWSWIRERMRVRP